MPYQLSLDFMKRKPLSVQGVPVYQGREYQSLYDLQGLGVKVVRERPHLEDRITVSRPSDLEPILKGLFEGEQREFFYSVLLDSRNVIEALDLISIGTLNSSMIHPRELFKLPIILGAASLVCCHNHPSGSTDPSREDIELTKRLKKCSDLLGLDFLDHIIYGNGNGRYLSLKEAGMF